MTGQGFAGEKNEIIREEGNIRRKIDKKRRKMETLEFLENKKAYN